LRELDKLSWKECDEKILTWPGSEASASDIFRRGQFLINRIETHDRIVVQLASPMTQFFLFEVGDGYDYGQPEENDDFNHILRGNAISTKPIPFYSKYISNELRHALVKRGKYYQIYPEGAIKDLDALWAMEVWNKPDVAIETDDSIDMLRFQDHVLKSTIEMIRTKWPSKYFEQFVADVLRGVDNVDVLSVTDSHQGWDLIITIRDTLDGEVSLSSIPVQCKNYCGEADWKKPCEDLERAIRNSPKEVATAYLAIMGTLTDHFYKAIESLETRLTSELGRRIEFRVIDETQLAKLYLSQGLSYRPSKPNAL